MSGVDADLSTFISNVKHVMSATTADSLVKMGTTALGLEPTEINVQSYETEAGSNPSESAEVQRRMLPFMKSTAISSPYVSVSQSSKMWTPRV